MKTIAGITKSKVGSTKEKTNISYKIQDVGSE
jgi:hypothetical protein